MCWNLNMANRNCVVRMIDATHLIEGSMARQRLTSANRTCNLILGVGDGKMAQQEIDCYLLHAISYMQPDIERWGRVDGLAGHTAFYVLRHFQLTTYYLPLATGCGCAIQLGPILCERREFHHG